VGFAVVLYTPCDIGGLSGDSQRPRARQNVVFEHGYLIGKLGRNNVSALVKGDVEIPNDISGVVYVPLDQHGAWRVALAKELRTARYPVDMNRVV
jgi:predicted nucleotide-binding protein